MTRHRLGRRDADRLDSQWIEHFRYLDDIRIMIQVAVNVREVAHRVENSSD